MLYFPPSLIQLSVAWTSLSVFFNLFVMSCVLSVVYSANWFLKMVVARATLANVFNQSVYTWREPTQELRKSLKTAL